MGDTADSGSTEPTYIGAGRGVGKPYEKTESLEKVRAVLDGKLCTDCVGSEKRRQRIMARILVIEDETDIRGVYRRLLEQAEHEVIEARDGDLGVKLHRKNPTDLIITDIIMPEKDGIETITEIRRDFPRVKIIAISGEGTAMAGATCPACDGFPLGLTLVRKEVVERQSREMNY
jgi:CheY-like chemotaxis protein